MNHEIRIAIADQDFLARKGFFFILNRKKEFKILFEAESTTQLLNILEHSEILPSIILMDLETSLLKTIETIKMISNKFSTIKIIVFSRSFIESSVIELINAGAVSYLLKNITKEQVIQALKKVQLRGFFYTEKVMDIIHKSLLYRDEKNNENNSGSELLTKREKEVLRLICKQYTANEIANKLFISRRTVEHHRVNLYDKTESKNCVGLVIYSIKNKLIDI